MRDATLTRLTTQRVPTVLGYDVDDTRYTIGDEARRSGLEGPGTTNVFNFKPLLGLSDAEFTKPNRYFFSYPRSQASHNTAEPFVRVFSAKGAVVAYLRTLLDNVSVPDHIIVGVPSINDKKWRDYFRSHMKDVFLELGRDKPAFVHEAFVRLRLSQATRVSGFCSFLIERVEVEWRSSE